MVSAAQSVPDIEQFLTFRLGGEEFGVQIQQVQGIQGWDKVTQIPETPPHVLGVIDLRGTVVPIIDLRRRLGFKRCDFNATTVVIVVKVEAEGEEQTYGLVVDAVSEVCDLAASDRKDSPDFGGGVKAEYMLGLATTEDKMVILLDLDRLMSDVDFGLDDEDSADTDEATVSGASATAEAADAAPAPAIDVATIEASFQLLAPEAEQLVERFYENLFEQYPAVMPMFADTNMAEQKKKLLGAIALVVENIRAPEALVETLAKLGAAHQKIGAEPAHYEAVASTMLGTMAELAGEAWTAEIEQAWRGALELVAAKMLEGYSDT